MGGAAESSPAMLDIRVIRENPDFVKERLKTRGGDHWKLVDEVIACDETRRASKRAKDRADIIRLCEDHPNIIACVPEDLVPEVDFLRKRRSG